jgi:hypothetical protein
MVGNKNNRAVLWDPILMPKGNPVKKGADTYNGEYFYYSIKHQSPQIFLMLKMEGSGNSLIEMRESRWMDDSDLD